MGKAPLGVALPTIPSPLQINQRDAQFATFRPAQVSRCLDHDHLKRRPYDGMKQMTSAGRSVTQPKDNVHMQARLSVICFSDIANRTENLTLFEYRDLPISSGAEIEPADGR